jgi:hypothetical protein
MKDLARVWATIAAAVLQIVVPVLGAVGWLGRMEGAEFQTAKTPLVPAGYAFSIWSLIFAASLVYAFEQAQPSRRTDPLLRRVGWPMAAAMGVNALWSALAQLELPLTFLFVVFIAGFSASLVAVVRLFRDTPRSEISWRVGPAIGLQAGWVSVAIFANLSVALADLGLGGAPSAVSQAIILLSVSGVVASGVAWLTRGAVAYPAAVVWALVALAVAAVTREDAMAMAVAAIAWLCVLLGVTVVARWRNEPSGVRAA